jgi:hypothetical protein
LVVTRLGRCEQREQAAVGLEIYKWRTIDAIEPAHEKVCSFEPYKRHELRPDQVRSDRRADGKSAAGNAVIPRTLPNEISTGQVKPVKYFAPFVLRDTVESRYRALEHLNAASRPVRATLARVLQATGPRRVDRANENNHGVGSGRPFNRDLSGPDFVEANHRPASLVHNDHHVGLLRGRILIERLLVVA